MTTRRQLTIDQSLAVEKSNYTKLVNEIQNDRVTWNAKRNQRLTKLKSDLGNSEKFRYWVVNGEGVYGKKNPIDMCFDPLMLDRAKINLAMRDLEKDCRVRGFSLFGAQAGILGGCFCAFLRVAYKHPMRLNLGLVVFIGIVTYLGNIIMESLKTTMDEQIQSIDKDLDDLLEKAAERVEPFAVRVYTPQELNITTGPTGLDCMIRKSESLMKLKRQTVATAEKLRKSLMRQEDRIVNLLKNVKKTIDGKKLKEKVNREMLICWVFIICVAILARFFLLPDDAPTPSILHQSAPGPGPSCEPSGSWTKW